MVMFMKKEHNPKVFKRFLFLFLVFLFLINLNPRVAYAMENIPVFGNFVKIVIIRNYFREKENELDLNRPQIEYDKYIDKKLNTDIENFTNKIIEQFYMDFDEENHKSTKMNYEIVLDTEEWFTLKLDIVEEMASSNHYYKYYHIDKIKNKLVILADLFKNGEYKKAIVRNIIIQMQDQMKENDSVLYWINEKNEEENFTTISDNQNFYFNDKGNIMIVFNKYEVGPGFMGTPIFEISKSVYEKYLK